MLKIKVVNQMALRLLLWINVTPLQEAIQIYIVPDWNRAEGTPVLPAWHIEH